SSGIRSRHCQRRQFSLLLTSLLDLRTSHSRFRKIPRLFSSCSLAHIAGAPSRSLACHSRLRLRFPFVRACRALCERISPLRKGGRGSAFPRFLSTCSLALPRFFKIPPVFSCCSLARFTAGLANLMPHPGTRPFQSPPRHRNSSGIVQRR